VSAPRPQKRTPAHLRGPATLADVAKIARVSAMTASRALHKPHLVTEKTGERVRAAAEALAYVPNRIAGGLSSRRSNVVVAVIPSTLNPIFSAVVESLRSELVAFGYELFLGLSDYETERESEIIRAIIGRRPAGIVLTGVVHSPEVRRHIAAAQIPVVETWDLTPTPMDIVVGFSNEGVGRAAAHHLLRRGCRRLALVVADDQRAQIRRKGFAAALSARRARAAVVEVVHAPSSVGAAREAARRLFALKPKIDGVFCSSDQLAMGVLFEASARGIAVPRQVAVVGFGNVEASAHTHPALTTVAIDGAAIGREAARMLLARLENAAGNDAPRVVDVGFHIVVRESA
jgi:LacI family transcriptional regulator, gluconate utilization system Gnt-I transcriptional repressor